MKDIEKIEDELEEYYLKGRPIKEHISKEKLEAKKEEAREEELNIFREILTTVIYIFAALAVTFLFINFVGERTLVSGSSMEDTLSHGDQLYLDKLTYRLKEPERFDVIVFPYEEENSSRWVIPFKKSQEVDYIKRIIGLPGETVYINEAGEIYIDGKLLEEDYGMQTMEDPGIALYEVKLGPDEYFVLGDNRNNSKDSRFSSVGNVKKENIIGKARARIYPFNKMGSIYK